MSRKKGNTLISMPKGTNVPSRYRSNKSTIVSRTLKPANDFIDKGMNFVGTALSTPENVVRMYRAKQRGEKDLKKYRTADSYTTRVLFAPFAPIFGPIQGAIENVKDPTSKEVMRSVVNAAMFGKPGVKAGKAVVKGGKTGYRYTKNKVMDYNRNRQWNKNKLDINTGRSRIVNLSSRNMKADRHIGGTFTNKERDFYRNTIKYLYKDFGSRRQALKLLNNTERNVNKGVRDRRMNGLYKQNSDFNDIIDNLNYMHDYFKYRQGIKDYYDRITGNQLALPNYRIFNDAALDLNISTAHSLPENIRKYFDRATLQRNPGRIRFNLDRTTGNLIHNSIEDEFRRLDKIDASIRKSQARKAKKLNDLTMYNNGYSTDYGYGTMFGTKKGMFRGQQEYANLENGIIDFVNNEGYNPLTYAGEIPKEVKFKYDFPFSIQQDITGRNYTGTKFMDPDYANKVLREDIAKLKSGEAEHLTKDGATSSDSYSLENTIMKQAIRHNTAKVKFMKDINGNPIYQSLNDFGKRRRLTNHPDAEINIKNMNESIKALWEESGETGPAPLLKRNTDYDIGDYGWSVPSRYARKYKYGGRIFKSRF